MNLTALKAKRKLQILASRQAHGKWVKSVDTSSLLATAVKRGTATVEQLRHAVNQSRDLHGKWKKTLADLQATSKEIAALEAASGKDASACSLDLAKSVAAWEGGQSRDGLFRPYQDAVRVWTIGYGHTNADGAPVVGPGTRPLTRAEAETLLLHDLNVAYSPAVAHYASSYGLKLNQKQFDALTSFCYNLGAGYFGSSHDIGAAMKAHNYPGIACAMLLYDRAGSSVLAGLVRRRRWEAQLFNGGTYSVS